MNGLPYTLTSLLCITLLIGCHSPLEKKITAEKKLEHTDTIGVKFELVTDAIAAPIEYIVPPDNTHRIFITDNKGMIWLLKNDSLHPRPFLNFKNRLEQKDKKSQPGEIFSIAFHPQFASNSKFFVCYAKPSGKQAGTFKFIVSEFTVDKSNQDIADLKTERQVMELENKNIVFNGAQIAFGPDGYLYISIGDDKLGDSTYIYHAQDLNYLNGKLLRIDVNKTPYAIPADNPFIGIKNTRPEIWAYGFRKLWRFCFDSASHQLFGADVGELKQEEINIVKKGGNYGWPIKEGDSIFENNTSNNQATLVAPIYAYTHKDGICIIGGSFYYGRDIPPLMNKYVFADFNGSLFALSKDGKDGWIRQVLNKPADPFLICGSSVDENNELIVLGILNTKAGFKGAVYKIVKG
ncbi:PQQ-dependent sugar dehydrogenase [Flavihumibacter fluvii]|uniref:PQQ-dependent sugar dehydrogenase n=1 Tax=Flavihumibacter fluvii TaxID=2838157 RepID=UPI001BDDCE92|nr:PQQ-dependent sugar dehydrogenase [Flavihumibacter fluvii]ULQ52705.1 PQQ-dependent sugar dehydrogenase [Flavihumibacter fluvii]